MSNDSPEILASIQADLDVALSEHGTFEGVAGRVVILAQRLMRADGASITQRVGDMIVYIAGSGTVASLKGRRVTMSDSSTGEVLQTGESYIFKPESAQPGSRSRARVNDVRSGLIVPVFVDDHVAGTVGVVSTIDDFFDEAALKVLEGFAAALSEGVSKQRERAQRRNRL